MEIREAQKDDLCRLLTLYTHLHGNAMPENSRQLQQLWKEILEDRRHHILLGEEDGKVTCSCVLITVPNLTHGQRPYGLIENVITHPDHRGRGHATALLHFAREMLKDENGYKLMLMSGAKDEGTLHFYEKAGFNRRDKTAFVQWL